MGQPAGPLTLPYKPIVSPELTLLYFTEFRDLELLSLRVIINDDRVNHFRSEEPPVSVTDLESVSVNAAHSDGDVVSEVPSEEATI